MPPLLQYGRLLMFALFIPARALPTPDTPSDQVLSSSPGSCGPVSQYFNPNNSDWDAINTQDWLNNWWNNNSQSFSENNNQGLSGALGQQFLGVSDFLCRDNGGQDNNCDLNVCNNKALNEAGHDMEPAYYVMLSVQNLANHFQGLQEAYTDAGIFAALMAPDWASKFFLVPPPLTALALEEAINGIAIAIGIIGGAIGAVSLVVGAIGAALAVTAGGLANAFNYRIGIVSTPSPAGDLGKALADYFKTGIQGTIDLQNTLMAGGQSVDQHDIRSFISHGSFLDRPGIDVNTAINHYDTIVTAKAINTLWTAQKVFIVGGVPCDFNGLGSGPQEAKFCRSDNTAWYLYFWHEGNFGSQYGWVTQPPGMDMLGSGDYANITLQNVISSSVDSYNVAMFNYSSSTALSRVEDAITNGWANPFAIGAAWEGTFTIPVCDIGWAVNNGNPGFDNADKILQPYGGNSRPMWCGPICKNDHTVTQAFINAAHMDEFQSPKYQCPTTQNMKTWGRTIY
ncbi:hypothetical protein BGZ63DRAFT_433443 [Mariannaea sp. PMI_226]|nr:hypothetical protein BGZ63DRAFT_433443 [Mariannaea sp. PMI_226]